MRVFILRTIKRLGSVHHGSTVAVIVFRSAVALALVEANITDRVFGYLEA